VEFQEGDDAAYLHFYEECFDEWPGPLYLEMWQQTTPVTVATVAIPPEVALKMADELSAWAARVRKYTKHD
jgi:hypothetical protein